MVMNMKKLRMVTIVLLCVGLIVGCNDWNNEKALNAKEKELQEVKLQLSAKQKTTAKEETVVAKQETVAVKQDASPAAPPDMKVGNLTVVGKITTPEIVAEKKITTPKIKVKEKIKAPKIVVEKEITTPKLVTEKVDTKLLEAEKIKTKELEAELARVKLVEIEKAKIKEAKVDKMTVKEAEVSKVKIDEVVRSSKSAAKPVAALKCDSKGCWPKDPKGDYFPIGTFGNGIPIIGNVNNPTFTEKNAISAKREFHGVWGKKMVARNLTVLLEDLLAIPELNQEISQHYEKMGSNWPVNPSDKDGDVCDEKTWIINPATKTWSIRK
jgi:hypothetical protein